MGKSESKKLMIISTIAIIMAVFAYFRSSSKPKKAIFLAKNEHRIFRDETQDGVRLRGRVTKLPQTTTNVPLRASLAKEGNSKVKKLEKSHPSENGQKIQKW